MQERSDFMKKDENIITLNGEKGEKLSFYVDAELEYDGYKYLVLRPVDKFDDLDADQAIVFRVEETEDGEEYFIEQDDEIINAIEDIYNSGC